MALLGNDLKTIEIGDILWREKHNQNIQELNDNGITFDMTGSTTSTTSRPLVVVKAVAKTAINANRVVRFALDGSNIEVEEFPASFNSDETATGSTPLGVVTSAVSAGATGEVIVAGAAEVEIDATTTANQGAWCHVVNTSTVGRVIFGAGAANYPVVGYSLETLSSASAGDKVLLWVKCGFELL